MIPPNESVSTWSPRSPQTIIGSVLVIVAVITTVGNAVVLAAVYRSRFLMPGFTHYFVCSLALADFTVGLLVMAPGALYMINGSWVFGYVACSLWNSLDMFSTTASIQTLCVIAMDRYVAVTAPLHYQFLMTRRRAYLLMVSVWFVATLTSFLPIQVGWWRSDDPFAISCYENPECCDFIINNEYNVGSCLINFYIPVLILTVLYARILIEAKKQERKMNQMKMRMHMNKDSKTASKDQSTGSRENRALKTLLLIMGAFILFWLPFFITCAVQVICYTCLPENVFNYTLWFGYSNSTINPILYAQSPDFRGAYKRLLKSTDGLFCHYFVRNSMPVEGAKISE